MIRVHHELILKRHIYVIIHIVQYDITDDEVVTGIVNLRCVEILDYLS